MSKQRCANCVYFKALGDTEYGNGGYWLAVSEDGVPNGRCRFNPPTVNREGFPVRPRVAGSDWCGRWRSAADDEATVLKSAGLSMPAFRNLVSGWENTDDD